MKNKILRGKKWLAIKEKAVFDEDTLTLSWIPTQESIVEDMKAYEATQGKEETKSKEKK